MTVNLIVFTASVFAIAVGVTAAFGWAFGLIATGAIMASVTLLATLARGKP